MQRILHCIVCTVTQLITYWSPPTCETCLRVPPPQPADRMHVCTRYEGVYTPRRGMHGLALKCRIPRDALSCDPFNMRYWDETWCRLRPVPNPLYACMACPRLRIWQAERSTEHTRSHEHIMFAMRRRLRACWVLCFAIIQWQKTTLTYRVFCAHPRPRHSPLLKQGLNFSLWKWNTWHHVKCTNIECVVNVLFECRIECRNESVAKPDAESCA